MDKRRFGRSAAAQSGVETNSRQGGFVHWSKLGNQGSSATTFDGRSVIGSGNSWSARTPGNAHLRQAAYAVARRRL